MAIDSQHPEARGKTLTVWGFVWRTATILFVLLLISCTGLTFWVRTEQVKYRAELNEVLDAIRSRGEPLEAAEIAAYYAVAEDVPDLTLAYLRAIAPFEKAQPLTMEQQALPFVGTSGTSGGLISAELLPIAEAYLQDYHQSLDELRALSLQPGRVAYPVPWPENFSALLTHVQSIRSAARNVCLEFDVRLRKGERQAALDSLRSLLRLGETLEREPLLISQLVRLAVFGMACERAEAFLNHSPPTTEELAEWERLLSSVPFGDGLRHAMLGERSMAYLMLKQRDLGSINELSGQPRGSMDRLPTKQFGTMLEARPGDAALLLELQTEAIAAAESPFPDALDKLQTLEQRLKQMTVDEKYTLPWNRHLYSQLLLPASYQVGVAFARSVAMQRSLLAVIAAERYERAEQKLAQSWEDLAPTFLAEVPLDPFNGAPLIFSRTKTGYLIYSVGKDRVDGGGDFGPNLQGNDWGIRVEREAQKP